ncbi:MAG: hypothetical protein QMD88_06780 [Coprothermobacterota bacterium]|nr:hypothetical protein [Coprothermobacterota bacterium]
MSLNIDELCKDPLFQINLAIWLAQPQPLEDYYVYPLFYKSGLNVYSISPKLSLPPEMVLETSGKVDCQGAAKPDLVLEAENKKKLCILECKASSFSPESSTAKQARTLLIACSNIARVLAISERGEHKAILCYLTGLGDIGLMEDTLTVLAEEVKEKTSLGSGNHGCFVMRPSQSAIQMEYSQNVKDFLNLERDPPVEVMELKENTNPHPLYFIPYDPNIDQPKEEKKLCRRILFERILSYMISKIGGASVPSRITLTLEELLDNATFGIYEIWEDQSTKKYLRKLVQSNFLSEILKSIGESIRPTMPHGPDNELLFDLGDKATQEELLNHLQKFLPETLDLSKEIEPGLFDNVEE